MLDYIIVGFGLAGLSYVEQLDKNGESYHVFENYSQRSSRVAGGLYNPVVLKRFTMAWNATSHMAYAIPFYKQLEKKLEIKILNKLPVFRRFTTVEEQNLWFEALDNPKLSQFLSPNLVANTNYALDVPHLYGEVLNTGRIAVSSVLKAYEDYLISKKCWTNTSFDYKKLVMYHDSIEYDGICAKHIVFTEGFGMQKNPLFNTLPLYGNKGEYLLIKSKELQLKEAVKSSVFIIPLGDDLYKIGATYDNKDTTPEATLSARTYLQQKLEKIIKAPYIIIDQESGIRPTTRDRRPIVGTHPIYKNAHVLNGLGSRGILTGPIMAKQLYDFIEEDIPLDIEVDIKRFL